jgi:serine/threonine protein phosphatase PrpC
VSTLAITDSGGVSETGRVRRSNEDSYLMRGILFMVADGMGGAAAGELASAICTEAFAEIDLIRSGGDAALRDAIRTANQRIVDRAASDPEVAGMGTTVTAALFGDQDRVVLANVGDSRAYLLRDGKLQRLSQDHSVVAELVASGQISEDEAEHHPQRSVITRVLGAEASVQIDIFWLDAQQGDVLMLCSDGLTTMVPESRIAELLASDRNCEQIAESLADAAIAAGGEDNVTAIVFRIGPRDEATAANREILTRDPDLEPDESDRPGRSTRSRVLRTVAALAVLGLLAGGFVAGLRWAHFVGADETTGHVAVYQGLPIDLFAGVKLYHEVSESPVAYASLDAATRKQLFDHRIRSKSSAEAAVRAAEQKSP